MAPVEVTLLSFTGTGFPGEQRTRYYRLPVFIIFSSTYIEVISFFFLAMKQHGSVDTMQKNSVPLHMTMTPSFLQLQIIGPPQKMGKGGSCHA